MPVYNGEKFLAEAIESMLGQTYSNFEFLIVDDGSADNSVKIARAYAERDSRIRLFQLERNMGKADARNVGCFAAKGDYIAGMDCDDISLPLRLEKQVNFLETNPGIGLVGVCADVVDEDTTTLLYKYMVAQSHSLIVFNWFIGESYLGGAFMLRRAYFEAVDGYEPGRRAVDDLDLLARLFSQTDIQLANLPDFLYLYRRHELARQKHRGSMVKTQDRLLKRRMLAILWDDVSEEVLDRFHQLRLLKNLGWRERKAVRKDLRRLINAMISEQWVNPGDKSLLVAEMNRRLEQASPRRWQQFCHWRRHRFPRLFPDTFQLYQ